MERVTASGLRPAPAAARGGQQRSAGPVLPSQPMAGVAVELPALPTADREAEAGELQPPELTQLIKPRAVAANRLYRVRQKDTVAAAETERTADRPPLVAPRNMAERVAGPADIPVQSELWAVDHYTPPDVETAEAEETERVVTGGPVESQAEAGVARVVMLVKRVGAAALVLHVFGRGDGIQGHSGDRRTVGSPGRRRCVGDHIPATLGERLPGAER